MQAGVVYSGGVLVISTRTSSTKLELLDVDEGGADAMMAFARYSRQARLEMVIDYLELLPSDKLEEIIASVRGD